MRASDLRIGNIVDMGSEGIGAVSGYNLYQKSIHDNGGSVADYYHSFKPIPLTEEWLLKFGFGFTDYEIEDDFFEEDAGLLMRQFSKHYHDEIYHDLTLNSDNFNEFGIRTSFAEVVLNGNCKYVHQLQNLYFALTGTELTIK